MNSSRWHVGVTMLLCIWAYQNSFAGRFVFDDLRVIEKGDFNSWWPPATSNLRQRYTGHFLFALNQKAGRQLWAYHTVNLVIHMATALVLYALLLGCAADVPAPTWLRRCRGQIALGTSMLWAVHPLQTESVTYIVQRYESLMSLFLLVGLWCILRDSRSSGRVWSWQLCIVASFWLSAGGKVVGLMGLLLFPLFDRAYCSATWRDVLSRRGVAYVVCGAVAVWQIFNMSYLLEPGYQTSFLRGDQLPSSWEYLRSQPGVLLHYLSLVYWPRTLCLDYAWPVAESTAAIYGLGAFIVATFVISAFTYCTRPRVGFLCLSVFLILAPTSSFLPIMDLAVEHRMYLPSAGIIALTVLLFFWVLRRFVVRRGTRTKIGWITLATVVAILVNRTRDRNLDYQDETRLWRSAVAINPLNPRAQLNLGRAFRLKGDDLAAEKHYRLAIVADNDYYRAYGNLASLLSSRGEAVEAEQLYRKAIELKPNFGLGYANYGNMLVRLGRYEEAFVMYQSAITSGFDSPNVWGRLANAHQVSGNDALAVTTLDNAIRQHPESIPLMQVLSWYLATSSDEQVRDAPRSLELAKRVSDAHRNFATLDVLAASLAENGRFKEAFQFADEAFRLAEQANSPDRGEIFQRRVGYRQGIPFRRSKPAVQTRPALTNE